jgi:hypothetical protein
MPMMATGAGEDAFPLRDSLGKIGHCNKLHRRLAGLLTAVPPSRFRAWLAMHCMSSIIITTPAALV